MKHHSSVFTPALAARLVAALKAGQHRKAACAAAGIGASTLQRWLTQGAAGEEPYAALTLQINEVEAECEARAVLSIQIQGREDWRALAWYLERRFPLSWGDTKGAQAKLDAEREAMLDLFVRACARRGLSDAAEEVLSELSQHSDGEAPAARGATQPAH